MLDPHMGSEIVVHFLYPLKNAENYHRGNLTRFDEVGIHAENDRTLQFELEYPSTSFLVQLSYFFPVQESSFPEGRFRDGAFRWGIEEANVSNGAYRLKRWVTNELIVLEKNPFYWDIEKVRLDEIHFFPISDLSAEERAFRAGQLDITSKVPNGRVAWYQENVPQALRVDERLGLFFLQLNHGIEPLNKVEVRKALAMSINRKELVDLVLKDGKQAASWVLPPGLLHRSTDNSPLAYDVLEAQRLLTSVGFP
jgi:oligopeptide transport system substrate-binding protein